MKLCPACQVRLESKQLKCPCCQLVIEGSFRFPRLARLAPAHLALAEEFILAGGNLKDLGAKLDLSYPTVRKRVDEMRADLARQRAEDAEEVKKILARIERQEISVQEGTRMIKEINNEL